MNDVFAARLAEVRARYVVRLADARAELEAGPLRERLIVLAHNLAGSGATYGYHAVSTQALALETALNAGMEPGEHLQNLLSVLQDLTPATQ